MSDLQGKKSIDKGTILKELIKILEEMTSEWESGFGGAARMIGPGTRLVADLGLESIQVVKFANVIETCFRRRNIPFQKLLMPDNRIVSDLCISEVVDFLYIHLND